MAEPELPHGRYLTVAYQVHPEAGGQTRAMLMRTRILAQQGGVRPEVLALGPVPDSDARRAALLEQGALIEEIATRNLYDHYREHGWGDEPPGEPNCRISRRTRVEEQPRADGSVLRVVYQPPAGRKVYDYLRADGTPFLRVAAHQFSRKPSWPRSILRVGPDGRVCGEFVSLRALHQRWLRGAHARRRARLRLHRLALRAPAPRAAPRPADAAALPDAQPAPAAAGAPLGRRRCSPRYKRVLKRASRRRRLRHAHRAPARRDRRAPRAHEQHARRRRTR